jgi:hypothetical protein
MANRSTAGSIDEYIAGSPPETQKALKVVRALIKASAPDATETISYAIPTFDLNGRHLVHFAGYEKHIGFYPVPSGIAAFAEELKPYMRGALLDALPAEAPGLTREEILEAVPPLLPQGLYPGGEKAGWWSKAVQLDLEAKGVIAREASKPLRWHRIAEQPGKRWKNS